MFLQNCKNMHRVITYNILSDPLVSSHIETSEENKDPENRMNKLLEYLESEIARNSIINFQEVSISQNNKLSLFFQKNNYYWFYRHYGKHFNNYMGIAIAVPKTYHVNRLQIDRVSDTRKWPKKVFSLKTRCLNHLCSCASVLPFLKHLKPKESTESHAKRRDNNMLMVEIQKDDEIFCVGNYHMPCAYRNPDLMAMHLYLSIQNIINFSGMKPFVFAGDFNIKTTDDVFRLITDSINEESSAYVDWASTLPYPLTHLTQQDGTVPEFTNYSVTKYKPSAPINKFVGTLDHFFVHGIVGSVENTPCLDDMLSPLPNDEYPSDHIPLVANVELI